MVEAGKFKQTSLNRLEKTYDKHLKDTYAFTKTFANLSADDITATINAKKRDFKLLLIKENLLVLVCYDPKCCYAWRITQKLW